MSRESRAARRASNLLTGLLSLAIFAAALFVAPAGAQVRCGAPSGGWTSISVPQFPQGEHAISAYAIHHFTPDVFFVTNGRSVMRSLDGGCTWSDSFALGTTPSNDYPYAPQASTITSVVSPGPPDLVLMTIEEQVGGTYRPHVLVSNDRGESWETSDAGLPPAGRPEVLTTALTAPVAYLGIDVGRGVVDLLYASQDGGETWNLRSDVTKQGVVRGITGLVVDPFVPAELWASGPGGLYHSMDAGASFSAVEEFEGTPAGPVDVFHGPADPARVLGFRPGRNEVLQSVDGGETWFRIAVPGDAESVAHGSGPGAVMISVGGDIYFMNAARLSWERLPQPRPGIVDVTADRASVPAFYGHTEETIEIFTGAGEYVADATEIDLDLDLQDVLEPEREPKLTPARKKIRLDVGERTEVPYQVLLPAARTPLDVYFLVDSSDSMHRFITGLLRGVAQIAEGLRARGIDAQFGVGEFNDYPDPPLGIPRPNEPNFVYRRLVNIGAPEESLEAALEGIQPGGGGRYNAHLAALFQTATGAGQDIGPPGPLGEDVPPGQQANFRAGALRVVINATDDEFYEETNDSASPDIPSFEAVTRELNDRNVRHLGLSIGRGAIGDLTRVSRSTGSAAPAGGVDCDADGVIDLAAGDPLVCSLRGNQVDTANLVPAIVNLVEAVRSRVAVSLEVARGGAVVPGITPPAFEGAISSGHAPVAFTVTYRCDRPRAGTTTKVELQARGEPGLLATAAATVVCGELPEDEKRTLLATPIAVVAAGAALVAPPPPPPPPPPVPEFASQAQSQSQAQANAQAAAAPQEEEQPQLAFVHAYAAFREQMGEQYAMSSLRDEQPALPPGAFLGAGALVSLVFSLALGRQRRRTEVARQGVQSRS